jgi:Zn-dependent alcohol dehydrogenase
MQITAAVLRDSTGRYQIEEVPLADPDADPYRRKTLTH